MSLLFFMWLSFENTRYGFIDFIKGCRKCEHITLVDGGVAGVSEQGLPAGQAGIEAKNLPRLHEVNERWRGEGACSIKPSLRISRGMPQTQTRKGIIIILYY